MSQGLHVRRGGNGSRLLLLLHGLGADDDVWDPLVPHVEDRWRWAAVDLPGHGGSALLPRYSFGGWPLRSRPSPTATSRSSCSVTASAAWPPSPARGERLVAEVHSGWRLAVDPATFGVGELDAAGLRAAGHNAHVEDPAAVDGLLTSFG